MAEDLGANGLQRADEREGVLSSVATDGVRSRYTNAAFFRRAESRIFLNVGGTTDTFCIRPVQTVCLCGFFVL